IEQSTATESDLQGAGTDYPGWLTPYMSLPDSGYRGADVQNRIHQKALQIVNDAHATTPYDAAAAIEAYLRGPEFTYDLNTPAPPPGTDPIDYFLFTSKRGYCAYFASAMGDMLRSLGIPTRLVNGFGPGSFDSPTQTYILRGEVADTWVESFSPPYGWIPLEPTPDAGGYSPISRGTTASNPC